MYTISLKYNTINRVFYLKCKPLRPLKILKYKILCKRFYENVSFSIITTRIIVAITYFNLKYISRRVWLAPILEDHNKVKEYYKQINLLVNCVKLADVTQIQLAAAQSKHPLQSQLYHLRECRSNHATSTNHLTWGT